MKMCYDHSLPRSRFCLVTQSSLRRSLARRDKNRWEGDCRDQSYNDIGVFIATKCRHDLFYWQSYSISRHLKFFFSKSNIVFYRCSHGNETCRQYPCKTNGVPLTHVNTKFPTKKKLVANCGPYFIALQVINNYETQRLNKRRFICRERP